MSLIRSPDSKRQESVIKNKTKDRTAHAGKRATKQVKYLLSMMVSVLQLFKKKRIVIYGSMYVNVGTC